VFLGKLITFLRLGSHLDDVECTMGFSSGPLDALKVNRKGFSMPTKRLFYVIFISYFLKRFKSGLYRDLFPEGTF